MVPPTLLLVLLLCCIYLSSADLKIRPVKKDFAVISYLPDYRFYIEVDDLALHVTDIILFSVAPSSTGDLTYYLTPSNFRAAQHARRAKASYNPSSPRLRLLLTVGGAGRSQHFLSSSSDSAGRRKLVEALFSVCRRYELDGVDFDWEAPTSRHDMDAYQRLLSEASATFRPAGMLVTVALHPGQTLMEGGYGAVDRVHLMTYDMSYHGKNNGAGHHAAFDDVQLAAERIIEAGCPTEKLAIGIPFYGRGEGRQVGETKSFAEMVDGLELEETERRRKKAAAEAAAAAATTTTAKEEIDEKENTKQVLSSSEEEEAADKVSEKVSSLAPTASRSLSSSPDSASPSVVPAHGVPPPPLIERLPLDFRTRRTYDGGFLFDSQLDVQRKTELARTSGLSGVFFWEGGQDKLERHVSLAEQVALVANGTVTVSRVRVRDSETTTTTEGQTISIRERMRRQKEAEEARERASAKKLEDLRAAKIKVDKEEQERRKRILSREL